MIRQLRPGEAVPTEPPRRYHSSHGYIRLRWLVGTQQYVEVYEHRVVDGVVTTAEHVHHDNDVKQDNDPVNLVPLTAEEHNQLHADRVRGTRRYAPYRSKYAMEKALREQRRREVRAERAAEFRRLRAAGLNTIQIGEVVGLHPSGVSRILRWGHQ